MRQTQPDTTRRRLRLTGAQKAAFAALSPAALYIAGNDGPEPRFFGDNMGAWPVLIGVTRVWADGISGPMDRLSPHRPRGVLFRLWTPGTEAAGRLAALAEDYFKARVDQLRGRWLDMGPDCDLTYLELELHDVAERAGILAWDDTGLLVYLDEVAARRMPRQVR